MSRRNLLQLGGIILAAASTMAGAVMLVYEPPPPDKHDYEAVLEFYRENPRLLTFDPDHWDDRSQAHWVELAKAHISLGDLPEAVRCLERSAEIWRLSNGPDSVPLRELWAAVQFLMGNVGRAIAFHGDKLEGIHNGRIRWTDLSGGAETALMLMYYADRAGDAENLEYAIEFIRKLRKPRAGSMSMHAIGELSEQDMLMEEWKVSDWDSALGIASKTVAQRSLLQIASFGAALARGRAGDAAGRGEMLKYCAMIEPVYSSQWFLARRECNMPFRWRRRE
jgi:hypothetical protein